VHEGTHDNLQRVREEQEPEPIWWLTLRCGKFVIISIGLPGTEMR
jgi:hypothetical protein